MSKSLKGYLTLVFNILFKQREARKYDMLMLFVHSNVMHFLKIFSGTHLINMSIYPNEDFISDVK